MFPGAGKTDVACALGNKACQLYRKVLYLFADELFDRITIAERTGDKKRCLDAFNSSASHTRGQVGC